MVILHCYVSSPEGTGSEKMGPFQAISLFKSAELAHSLNLAHVGWRLEHV